jgi:hypothetical protein
MSRLARERAGVLPVQRLNAVVAATVPRYQLSVATAF